jgi:hypothetical protein
VIGIFGPTHNLGSGEVCELVKVSLAGTDDFSTNPAFVCAPTAKVKPAKIAPITEMETLCDDNTRSKELSFDRFLDTRFAIKILRNANCLLLWKSPYRCIYLFGRLEPQRMQID